MRSRVFNDLNLMVSFSNQGLVAVRRSHREAMGDIVLQQLARSLRRWFGNSRDITTGNCGHTLAWSWGVGKPSARLANRLCDELTCLKYI
jgi:hypothetical protein